MVLGFGVWIVISCLNKYLNTCHSVNILVYVALLFSLLDLIHYRSYNINFKFKSLKVQFFEARILNCNLSNFVYN